MLVDEAGMQSIFPRSQRIVGPLMFKLHSEGKPTDARRGAASIVNRCQSPAKGHPPGVPFHKKGSYLL